MTISPVHIMAKPVGPACNLRCDYCFYTEKDALYPDVTDYRMPEAVLNEYVRQYVAMSEYHEIEFTWQGGEPTLAGLDFFRRAVRLQHEYGQGRRIRNSLQTNGVAVDDEWCEFLSDRDFLVGLSLDGPESIHNHHRRAHDGRPTFEAVMRALATMQAHGTEYNILCCVTARSAERPLEIYDFLKSAGVRHVQFVPVVERSADAVSRRLGLQLGTPPGVGEERAGDSVTPWSVVPGAYGDFLCGVFDEWMAKDVGSVFVMNFEWALCSWMGLASPVCWSAERCGLSLVLEHNGDIYACDHFVYPEYLLGNLTERPLADIVRLPVLGSFGAAKETSLPGDCRGCPWLFACRGGCPKHRFRVGTSGEACLNYLCEGYRRFFEHVDPHMRTLARLLENEGSEP